MMNTKAELPEPIEVPEVHVEGMTSVVVRNEITGVVARFWISNMVTVENPAI